MPLLKFSKPSNSPKSSTSSLSPSSSNSWMSANNSKSANNKLFYVVLIGLILTIASNNMVSASAMTRCGPPCPGGECPEPPPNSCVYGTATDYCGRKICAKGPGEVCGVGMFKMLGICGDGMYCKCGRCIGCSLETLECFDKTCV